MPLWATVTQLLHRISMLSLYSSADRIFLPLWHEKFIGAFYIDIKAFGQKGEEWQRFLLSER